ncbi:MAG: TolC family protein [bacterium]
MIYKIKYLAAIMMVFILNGCGIYTKFTSPSVNDTSLMGEDFELREESIDSLPTWREYFTDDYLVALIEEALKNNVDLKIAGLNISQAERNLSTARMAYAPSFAIAVEGSSSRFGSVTTNSYSIPLVASWEIDLFGRLHNSKMQSKAIVEQVKMYESAIQSQLIAAVATSYYALVLADNQLSATKQSREAMSESLDAIKSLMLIGQQTGAAVEQAEANLKAIELTVEALEQSVKLTSNNLNLLLNRSAQEVERNSTIVTSSLELEGSLSLAALSSRPDVLYAEAILCQSFYGVNYARSSLYPSIGISASVGYSVGDMLLSVLGSITQPIFMANTNRAALKNAKDQYEQSLLSFELALLTAGKEVNDAMINLEASRKQRVLNEDQNSHLSRAVEITQELMQVGRVNYLEVLTAINTYLASNLELESVKYNEAIAKISLYKSLGGGVE